MKEYFTKALILDQENSGELDRRIFLYTEDLGKIVAKAKSARKITSKLAGHLEPFAFSDVRLIEKGRIQIVDALSFGRIPRSKNNLAFLLFLKEMTFEFEADRRLWAAIKKIFSGGKSGPIPYGEILKIMGFDPKFASCEICQSRNANYFSKTEQVFFCKRCSPPKFLSTLIEI